MDLGKLAKQAKKVVDERGDDIAEGIDKATDFVDKKTKGKHRDKLDRVDDLAEKLDNSAKADKSATTGKASTSRDKPHHHEER